MWSALKKEYNSSQEESIMGRNCRRERGASLRCDTQRALSLSAAIASAILSGCVHYQARPIDPAATVERLDVWHRRQEWDSDAGLRRAFRGGRQFL